MGERFGGLDAPPAVVRGGLTELLFRETYDAERALSQFAETARDEVELDVLAEQLVYVVQETVQPERVGLWLSDVEE